MPAWLGSSCTAVFNSACCSPVSAGGNLLTAQMTAPGDHPPQTSWPIDLWCGHPDPTPDLPPPPSIPEPAAISRATFLALAASTPDTSVVVPQPHPFATAPVMAPSPSRPTATPTPISLAAQLIHHQFYPTPMRVSPWLWFRVWVPYPRLPRQRLTAHGAHVVQRWISSPDGSELTRYRRRINT